MMPKWWSYKELQNSHRLACSRGIIFPKITAKCDTSAADLSLSFLLLKLVHDNSEFEWNNEM